MTETVYSACFLPLFGLFHGICRAILRAITFLSPEDRVSKKEAHPKAAFLQNSLHN